MIRAPLRAAATLCLFTIAAAPALAVGPPIQLATPAFTAFTGNFLVVADLDGVNGPDLAGVDGSNVVIAFRQAGGTFAPQQSYAMSGGDLEVADLDGDGRLDLVTVSSAGFQTRMNLGGQAFGASATTTTGAGAWRLALGDLNGDGHPDAVTALADSAAIAVSLNDGAGHLQSTFRLPVAAGTFHVAILDFTGDAKNDIVGITIVGSPPTGSCTITVFPGHGDGTFEAPRVTSFTNIAYRASVATGDLDEDGDLDLVFLTGLTPVWLANHGDGTFALPVAFGSPGHYDMDEGQIAVGDIDQDGHLDVVHENYQGGFWKEKNLVSVISGHGDGTFEAPAQWHVGMYPKDVALADLDGDGRLDVVVTTVNSRENDTTSPGPIHDAYLLRNRGFGVFDAHLEVFEKAWMPVRRSDGPADLVGSNNGRLTRSRNRGHGTFRPADDLGGGTPWRAVDLDGDGNDEIVVTSNDSLWVIRALAPGTYGPPSSMRTGVVPRDVADFDGDGKLDLLATDAALHAVVLPGDGAGGFGAPIDYAFTMPEAPYGNSIRGGDVDGDGRADLLFLPVKPQVLDPSSNGVFAEWLHVVHNDGAQHFAPVDSFAIQYNSSVGGGSFGDLAFGDFDGDHVLDVYMTGLACTSDNLRYWGQWRGLGGGAFAAVGNATNAASSPCALVAGDLNGDGLTDLVRANATGGPTMRVSTFTAAGGGSIVPSALGTMGMAPTEIFLADMDGDGHDDVVTHGYLENTGSIRRNTTVFDAPTATLLSLASADLVDGAAVLDWFVAGDLPGAATIERRTDASGWSLLAPLVPTGDGRLHYVDAALPAAARVGYRLRWSDADGPHLTAETWLTLPSAEFALAGAWPNPSRSTPAFAIELPRSGAVEVDVFDVGGRRVAHERLGALAAGRQRVSLGASLGPGVYVARLAFAGRRLETRFVVLQ